MRTEGERQAAILQSLWGQPLGEMRDALAWREQNAVLSRGMAAYQGNASATAERVLAAAYPTVQALLGEEALALLARQLWRHHPPTAGDLTEWGQALPPWLESLPEVQAWPYLPDCARVDWARHKAEHAPDTRVETETLAWLGTHDPGALCLELQPGLSLVRSNWPVITVWEAHQPGEFSASNNPDALTRLQQCLNEPMAETAVVWRPQWRAEVFKLPKAMAGWMSAMMAGDGTSKPSLSTLLDTTEPGFDLPQWLALALQKGWLWRVSTHPPINDLAD